MVGGWKNENKVDYGKCQSNVRSEPVCFKIFAG